MDDTTAPKTLADLLASHAPLAERLAGYARIMEAEDSPYVAEYDRLVARLAAGGIGAGAPAVGQPFPPFTLVGTDGRMVSLTDLLDGGHLVLSFNRGHWCPFCRIELDALAAVAGDIVALGARAVSVMPEFARYTAPLEAQFAGRVPILTDPGNGLALELGLAMWVGETVRGLLTAEDIRLDLYQGDEGWLLPLPATFIIASDGTVAGRFVDPDFRTRMGVEEILAVLAELQRR